uniref:Myosin motor domain-containing protein n=1 Tax=Rhizochromulina marina TaxID=1034831 RepID=A0A7S2RDF8_9STRA
MHLGNLVITDGEDEDSAVVQDSPALGHALRLLGVSAEDLQDALTFRSVRVAGTVTKIPLTEMQAMSARDSVAKAAYGALFQWTINNINRSLGEAVSRAPSTGAAPVASSSIAILDIYGFEVMTTNSLEQLLINLANESLQQVFNQRVLLSEKAMYERAGIVVDLSEAVRDDSATLELIRGRPYGVLPLLMEQNKLGPRGNDRAFLGTVEANHLNKESVQSQRFAKPRFSQEHFIIMHYAGDVIYDSAGFVEKNADSLREEALRLLAGTRLAPVASEFQRLVDDLQQAGGGRNKAASKETVATFFLRQLDSLMSELEDARQHYVRCVRPNEHQSPVIFAPPLVSKQLRYFGVMETVRIRRLGFPERKDCSAFVQAYAILMHSSPRPEQVQAMLADPGVDLQGLCREVIQTASHWLMTGILSFRTHKVSTRARSKTKERAAGASKTRGRAATCAVGQDEDFSVAGMESRAQFGNDGKLWMKDGFTQLMDDAVGRKLSSLATRIQTQAFGFLARRRYHKAQEVIKKVQAVGRRNRVKAKFRRERQAATRLAAVGRAIISRRRLAELRSQLHQNSATRIATAARRHVARRRFLRERASVALVAARWRSFTHARAFQRQRQAAISVQCFVRRLQATHYTRALKKAQEEKQKDGAVAIQKQIRQAMARKMVQELAARRRAAMAIQCAAQQQAARKERRQRLRHTRALGIQCMVRQALAYRKRVELAQLARQRLEHDCAAVLQAAVRSFLFQLLFTFVLNLRRRWKRLVAPTELVLLSGPCIWHRFSRLLRGERMASQRVEMVVTTHRRLLLIAIDDAASASGGELLKVIEWGDACSFKTSGEGASAKEARKFTLLFGPGGKKKANFSALTATGQRWRRLQVWMSAHPNLASTTPLQLWRGIEELNLGHGLEFFPVEMQGVLRKHPTATIKLTATERAAMASIEDDEDDDEDEEDDEEDAQREGKSQAGLVTLQGAAGGGGRLQTRHFMLQAGLLSYFDKPYAADPRGALDLCESSIGKTRAFCSALDANEFQIVLPSGRRLVARAGSEAERDRWVRAIMGVLSSSHVSVKGAKDPALQKHYRRRVRATNRPFW